jgi:hypothetical protein
MVRKLAASIWHVIGQGVFAMGTSDISFRESGRAVRTLKLFERTPRDSRDLDDSRSAVMAIADPLRTSAWGRRWSERRAAFDQTSYQATFRSVARAAARGT